jgi:hypothetical protein
MGLFDDLHDSSCDCDNSTFETKKYPGVYLLSGVTKIPYAEHVQIYLINPADDTMSDDLLCLLKLLRDTHEFYRFIEFR